jgi:hypothetical protein
MLLLTDRSSGETRSLNVHTRFVPLEDFDGSADEDDLDREPSTLLAMLLDDLEESSLFQDLSTRFVLQARVGARVVVRRNDTFVQGEIIERERARGYFQYLVSLNHGNEYEGSPVFLGDDLIGVVVRAGPGVVTVLGLEPIATRTSPSSFFEQNRQRASSSYRQAYQSLRPESRTKQDAIRESLAKMRLSVEDHDFNMT